MANTTMATMVGGTTTSNLLNPSDPRTRVVWGKLTAAYVPGTVVSYVVAAKTWTTSVNSTAAMNLQQVGVVIYWQRRNQTTQALKINTDTVDPAVAYDTPCPICTSGIVVAKFTDPSAAEPVGIYLTLSATTGTFAIQFITTGYVQQQSVATLAKNLGSGDTFAVVAIGQCMGEIWGGGLT